MEIEEKYNLLIIGGGPASVKFLYNLFRTSRLPEYMNGLGIGIVEKGKCFGSGNLENKMNYTTYPATELLKLMFFHKTNQMISICKDLTDTQAYKTLVQYGEKCPPKSLAGFFLRLLGSVLLKHIYTLKKLQIFHSQREAIAIRLLADGWFQIRTQSLSADTQIKDKYRTIKARHILLCTGREQTPADIFCQEQGLIETLKQYPRYIVGSGQKAFECAELLLSGPVMYINNEQINAYTQKVYTCPLCKSLKCSCFGSLIPQKYLWHHTDVALPEYKKGELKIHFSKPPRPYFNNHQNDYITIPQSQINKMGEANYLTGLRGKSKILFLKMLATQETRVSLSQNEPNSNQFIDGKECKCNQIEIKDTDGNLVEFQYSFGLYQLDDKGRLKTQKGSLRNLYCYGSNCITQEQLERGCQDEYGDCSIGFDEYDLFFLNIKNEIITQWFDNNEFPLTAQSQVSKGGDFDSDPSVHSEVVETETFALNQLQEQFKQKKKKK
ncbi:unnamed protein product [Paramecium pentaurelia]|uniref:FAD/NAD(P)-binding domain-containing protein n=1 Tax=Paramecium pentaurelia TaxID=43138 RepID=A0A8S1YGH6_9CILI|nr:unnamed protein product [Paramecium pentaurelia]